MFTGGLNKSQCSELCYFALKRHFTLAKGFIMILRFSIEETLPCQSVATADPRHTLLPFDALASPTLGSGSDAVFVYFLPPGGMPGGGGHSLESSDMPFCATLSIPVSQHNSAGATHRPAVPCCSPLEMGCVSAS